MTENQKIWLEELIDEYRTGAANESVWAKGADDLEEAQMHKANAEELEEFANLLATLLD